MDSTYKLIMKAVGFEKADDKTNKLGNSLGKLAKKASMVAGAYFGSQAVLNGVKQSLDLFGRQEQAVRKLDQALGKNTQGLQRYASQLQQVTRFGDEATIEQMAFLGSIGMTEDQIRKIIPVAMDLATATGMSLESAVRNTAKTFSGMAGELGELVPQIRTLTAEEMKAGKAVEVMGELFAGQAQADAQSYTGSIDQMKNAFGDVAESIGSTLAPAIQNVATFVSDFLTTPLSDQLVEDKNAMEDLFTIAQDMNASTDLRKDAIDEINEKYGKLLPNLLTEKTTLKELKKAQEAIGRAMLQNIAIEVNREKIAKNMQKQNDLKLQEEKLALEAKDANTKLNQAYADQKKAQEELNNTQLEGISNTERYKDDMAEFETALVSGTSAYDAFGYGVNNATAELREKNLALEENRLAQQDVIDNNEELINQAELLSDTYAQDTDDTNNNTDANNTNTESKKLSINDLRETYDEFFKARRKHSDMEVEQVAISARTAKEGALGVIQAEIAKATARLISTMLVGVPYPLNLIIAGTAGGLVNQLISPLIAKNLAEGFDGVVTSPTLFRAGEQGAERVQVTNLTKADGGIDSPDAMGNIIINAEVATDEFFERVIEYMDTKREFDLA